MVFLDFGGGSESDSDTDSGTTTIDPPPPPYMTVDGGGWISLVHLTALDKLNYSVPHTQVGLSEDTRFWVLDNKPNATYSVKPYNSPYLNNYEAEGLATPAETGWTWSGVDYPNPANCHRIQQLVVVDGPNVVPRAYGNPHFNAGQANPPGLSGAALVTQSTIGVAAVANYPSIHVGCVGWNVLKDPIIWIR
jgi:hypothetical protein